MNRIRGRFSSAYGVEAPKRSLFSANGHAYLACKPGKDYIEAVAGACKAELSKIAPCFQIIRYAEALGRRDFIFDVLLDEAEFYLIGGGNE